MYKLYIVQDDDDRYYYSEDITGNCEILVTNYVTVGDKTVSDFDDIGKAIDYARKIKVDDVTKVTMISIRKANGEFEKTWKFNNQVFLDVGPPNGSYGVQDIDVTVNDAYFLYPKEGCKSGIKIIFTEGDIGNGFKTVILNFVRDEKKWKMLYREKIDTRDDVTNHYCRDSTGYSGDLKNLPNFISHSDIADFYNCD